MFKNPILPGFYPDPSICRAGEDYYLVNSSFSYYPGLPIFHSRDLVNWRQIGHVLDRPSRLNLDNLPLSSGCYAPAIQYNKGIFYVTNTLVGKGENFIVTAKDPEGPWSDPYWIKNAPGIDPSLFFDDDGKVYWVGNGDPPESRYNGHKAIWMQEIDLDKMELVPGTKHILVNGGSNPDKNPIWIEGPHLYKVHGYYYLMAAEGGTAENHSEVIFRSTTVAGQYESYKGNPILTQRTLPPGRSNAITCTGHADMVETQNGEWWAVFLGCRPYEPCQDNFYNTGRETFMAPVQWIDGWPVINPEFEQVQYSYPAPNLPEHKWKNTFYNGNFTLREDFESNELAPYWIFIRTPREEWYSLTEKKGYLRIKLKPEEITARENPAFIGRRQQHLHFTVETAMYFIPQSENETAGIVAFQNEINCYYMGVTLSGGKEIICLEKGSTSGKKTIVEKTLPGERKSDTPLYLRIKGEGKTISFSYSEDRKKWNILMEDVDNTYLSTKRAGGFVGVVLGMYASSQGKPGNNTADFDWFEYRGYDPV
ncbi:MAG: glycoside hydrolase family 43 protein [Spirochaetales bacterium]|nr:glycoside hydrolase family 43 protein [Spirochaetales bacterium]